MKICCACLLILSVMVLSGCVSMSGYQEASLRHQAYTGGQMHATAAEWRTLISEFQEVIDMNPRGRSADDAQYAIASSWVWSIKTGDTEAPQQAIEAFQKLIRSILTRTMSHEHITGWDVAMPILVTITKPSRNTRLWRVAMRVLKYPTPHD